jgi:AcrR family transcriptional regulator
MGRYATSEETCAALVHAAGELFAEHGLEGVSTRAIAEKAGENIGSIHYHFGSKEGLHLAALRHAIRRIRENPLGRYLDEHHPAGRNPEQLAGLVTGFIACHFDLLSSRDDPPWCMSLIFHTLQRPGEARSFLRKELMDPILNAYCRLYRLVHPDSQQQAAQIWALNRSAESVFYAVFEPAIHDYLQVEAYSRDFLAEVLRQIQQSALLTLGLPHEEPEHV